MLLGAQYLAQGADGIAQAVFADELILEPLGAGTPVRILSLFALTLVPYSVIAPFLGVLVDRWPRRSLMVATNLLRAVLLVTIPIWARAFGGDLGLYIAILIVLGAGRLFLTTKGASLPVVLHERQLLRGNAISSGGGMISALVGGVVGLVAVDLIGHNGSFVLCGLAYFASAVVAGRISMRMAHEHPPDASFFRGVQRVALELIDGFAAIAKRARARLPLIGVVIVRTAGMLVTVAAILVIKAFYPEPDDDTARRLLSAVALGAAGAGAFIGATVAPLIGARFTRPGLIILGFLISGTGIFALGGIERIPALLVLTFIGGLGTFVAKVAVDAEVQAALPDIYRGRAFALYDIGYNLASVMAAGVMVAFQTVDLRLLLASTGLAVLAVAGALGMAMRAAGMFAAAVEPSDAAG